MKYLLILGRNPELSEAELNALYNLKIIKRDFPILIIETNDKIDINELGGTIKIAEIISDTRIYEEMELNISKTNFYTGSSNKPFFYITNYDSENFEDIESLIKLYFKNNKFKAVYKKPKSKIKKTSPSEIIKNKFPENCVEVILYKNIVAKTTQVFNPFLLKARDDLRPYPDFLQGISLRLAKILINLSGIKAKQTLLDPFCGTGTILQEALLKNINVIGTDKEEEMIKKAEKNIKWLKKNYPITANWKLTATLCKDISKNIHENTIDAVVTEPFMGPYHATIQKDEQVIKTINYLTQIYASLFLELNKVMKKNKKCVMIFPTFQSITKKQYTINMGRILPRNFKILGSISYERPSKMIIFREVKIIEKI